MMQADIITAAMFLLGFAGQEATQPEVHPEWTAQRISHCSSWWGVRQQTLQVTPGHSCWRCQSRQSAVSSLLGKLPPRPVNREKTTFACYGASVTLVQDRSSKLHKRKFTTASSVDRRLFSRDILAGRSHVPSVKSRCWCPHHRTDQSNESCNHRKVQMHIQVTREIVDWLVRPAYLAGCSWISK